MPLNRLLDFLQSLTKKELIRFSQYLDVFYADHKRLINFYSALIKLIDDGKFKKTHLEDWLEEVAGTEEITVDNLNRNVINRLTTCLEEFIAWQQLNQPKNKFFQGLFLIDYIRERHLDISIEKKIRKLESHLKTTYQNSWTLLKKFQLNYFKYFLLNHKDHHTAEIIFKKLLNSFDAFIIQNKLIFICEQSFREDIFGNQININFDQLVLTLAQTESFHSIEANQIYLNLLNLKRNSNKKLYLQLKKQIIPAFKDNLDSDKAILYGFLFNFIAAELKKGDTFYIKELKEWIDIGFKQKLLYQGKYIEPVVFNNQINLLCHLKDTDLAIQQIKKYQKDLHPNLKIDTLSVAWSYIHFEQKNYKKIIKEIYPPFMKNRLLNLRARIVLLRTFYELGDFDELKDFILACNKFLKRSSTNLSQENKEAFKNTISFTKKLINPKSEKNDLLVEINQTKAIFNKTWFIKKINSMLKE